MKKILMVEDDKRIIAALNVRLRARGYDVCAAYDATLAMTQAIAHQPDLALLDISMPGGDGFVVAERLRATVAMANIPIIFITALKQPGLKEKARALGAVAYFEKPFESNDLIAVIDTALGQTATI
jgi:two-component system KDP operon response regulator KdpE